MSAPPAEAPRPAELRARLAGLTLRDEARLGRRLQRLRPDAGAAPLRELATEVERAETRVRRRRALVPTVTYPPELPVSGRREDLLAALGEHQVVVVAGETGSGKTTQLPKLCLELGRGVRGAIAHTQPRRLAARTVAARIADELGVPLGEAVGYAVRFDDRSKDADTLVRLVTDGLLLAEVQRDPLLLRYDTVIVDEAHERSLNVDFLLGVLHRLLPRRPDLKLVITSATIDPGRFARHFSDAPVVEVSGRTYPVEVRYRPPDAELDPDPAEVVGDAVAELQREGPGDVLVFLSGEREIRDTAEALQGRFGGDTDVLPLYARLSNAEQAKVFRPGPRRRVVLATNVAETSLTVPGIRYVVDPGTARISRYSARLKVQRLPIEPVSQASADQRKGRCGRVAEGVCIRLYAEEDFATRPPFTDPEVLRTNLASVILQMAALGLGEIADFPFLDPPDRRQIRDGLNLLHELGAIDPGATDPRRRLTQTGRRLAQLPVDPRLGRMVLEAGRLRCVDEVVVIAAALSIQDPRERPADKREAADAVHARHVGPERSDFLAFVNLWRHLREQRGELSGNQFRRRCREEYLHYLRVREWQDLAGQLRAAARNVGLDVNEVPAEPDEIHQALLAGLLSHLGLRDAARREYQGARNARFALFPASALARKPPAWVMVAELVETSRLWGRTAARIEPRWVEPLAGHLLKRTYDDPRWSRERAAVVATERVTLYGLPIVAARAVAYGRIDPELARDRFLRSALVEGDWDTRHAFVAENARQVEAVRELQDRMRRMDLLVGDEALHAFFDARVPEHVVSGRHFDRWWKDERRRQPDRLTFTREDLLDPAAAATLDDRARPETWKQGDLRLRLSYAFDPGSAIDGVTVHVPLARLGAVRATGFDWLVPALRGELVTALLRALPKELRRPLVPIPETAAAITARLRPRVGPVTGQVADLVEELRGVAVPARAWDGVVLPPHLRMTFAVEGADGATLATGQDLEAVRAAVRPGLRAALDAAARGLVREGLRDWPPDLETLPREVEALGATGYPALADEGATVAVRVLESPEAQADAMVAGTRRLLALSLPSPAKGVTARLGVEAQLLLATAPHGGAAPLLEDAAVAALDVLLADAGGPVWTAEGFATLRTRVAGRLVAATTGVVGRLVRVLAAARAVQDGLAALRGPAVQAAKLDVERQRDRLLRPGLAAAFGAGRLPDVERYLRAAAHRLERLPAAPAPDLDRQRAITALEALADARGVGPADEAFWLLQELRVALFAPALGVHGSVSAKRVRRLLE